jgi:serine/threonine protein kinase
MENFILLIKKTLKFSRFEEHYVIGKDLGKGQFGKVKLGINKTTREPVAIKRIKKLNFKSKDFQMLKWEIDIFKLLKNASHPGVIKTKEIYETANSIYFVYEYGHGGNLQSFLKPRINSLTQKEI